MSLAHRRRRVYPPPPTSDGGGHGNGTQPDHPDHVGPAVAAPPVWQLAVLRDDELAFAGTAGEGVAQAGRQELGGGQCSRTWAYRLGCRSAPAFWKYASQKCPMWLASSAVGADTPDT